MRNVLLITKSAEYVVEVSEDVDIETMDVMLALTEKIAYLVAILPLGGPLEDRIWTDFNNIPVVPPNVFDGNVSVTTAEERKFFQHNIFHWIRFTKERAFAKFEDIMSKSITLKGVKHDVHNGPRGSRFIKTAVYCKSCREKIHGKRMLSGEGSTFRVQAFKPDDSEVFNVGKSWFCGCTERKEIPHRRKEETVTHAPIPEEEILVSERLLEIVKELFMDLKDDEIITLRKAINILDNNGR